MNAVVYGTLDTLAFEKSRFQEFWEATWQPTLEASQESFDAVPLAARAGDQPTTASALFIASALQAVTHNVTVSVLENPALAANPNLQALLAAVAACREDASFAKLVNDSPPFDSTINPDGTVTLSEHPEPGDE